MLLPALLPALLLLLFTAPCPSTAQRQYECIPNTALCHTCPPHRQWKGAEGGTLACCPRCAPFSNTTSPKGGRRPCLCPPLDTQTAPPPPPSSGNWSVPDHSGPHYPSEHGAPQYPSIEGKVITSGNRRPPPSNIVNTVHTPSLGPTAGGGYSPYAPRPTYATHQDLERHANAISALAVALDNLSLQFADMQKKIDYLMERDSLQFQQSESTVSIDRVGVPPTTANDLHSGNKPHGNYIPHPSKPGRPRPATTTTTTQKPTTTTTKKPITLPPINRNGCSYPFERVGDTCYYFSVRDYHRANWQVAQEACIKRGANLATLDSKKTFTQLARHLAASSTTASYRFWVGGLFPGLEWHWVYSGEKVALKRSQWTVSNANNPPAARFQARHVTDLFDLSLDNPVLKIILQNITRVIDRDRKKQTGVQFPIVSQASQTSHEGNLNSTTSSHLPGKENGIGVQGRQIVISASSNAESNNDHQRPMQSPLISLIHASIENENSQVTSREFREVRSEEDPWALSYGRCLVFQGVTNKKTFKFAAAQCGFDQYYVCQESNEI